MSRGTARDLQFDRGRSDRLVREVLETELPASIEELADAYDERVGVRDRFLWQWIYRVFDEFTLSCVPAARYEEVKAQKTVLTMFVTVLDDLADNYGDAATFEQARRLPHAPESVSVESPEVDAVTVEFAEALWERLDAGLSAAPRREAFQDVFSFDVRQVLDAIEYTRVVNDNPGMANLVGSRQYGPNNMVMFPYADVDLMYSPAFDPGEFGELRGLIWELQRMARIGNWLTTWEREVRENDLSAGVVIRAIERGLLSTDAGDPEELVRRVKRAGIEREFREEWEQRFRAVSRADPELATVDTARLMDGMRHVMEFHVASYGYK